MFMTRCTKEWLAMIVDTTARHARVCAISFYVLATGESVSAYWYSVSRVPHTTHMRARYVLGRVDARDRSMHPARGSDAS